MLPTPHHKGAVVWYSFGYCLSSLCRFERNAFFSLSTRRETKELRTLAHDSGSGHYLAGCDGGSLPNPRGVVNRLFRSGAFAIHGGGSTYRFCLCSFVWEVGDMDEGEKIAAVPVVP